MPENTEQRRPTRIAVKRPDGQYEYKDIYVSQNNIIDYEGAIATKLVQDNADKTPIDSEGKPIGLNNGVPVILSNAVLTDTTYNSLSSGSTDTAGLLTKEDYDDIFSRIDTLENNETTTTPTITIPDASTEQKGIVQLATDGYIILNRDNKIDVNENKIKALIPNTTPVTINPASSSEPGIVQLGTTLNVSEDGITNAGCYLQEDPNDPDYGTKFYPLNDLYSDLAGRINAIEGLLSPGDEDTDNYTFNDFTTELNNITFGTTASVSNKLLAQVNTNTKAINDIGTPLSEQDVQNLIATSLGNASNIITEPVTIQPDINTKTILYQNKIFNGNAIITINVSSTSLTNNTIIFDSCRFYRAVIINVQPNINVVFNNCDFYIHESAVTGTANSHINIADFRTANTDKAVIEFRNCFSHPAGGDAGQGDSSGMVPKYFVYVSRRNSNSVTGGITFLKNGLYKDGNVAETGIGTSISGYTAAFSSYSSIS